jgi:hypothetical protein
MQRRPECESPKDGFNLKRLTGSWQSVGDDGSEGPNVEEPATAPIGRIHDMLNRWKSWILFGIAFIAGLAAFLGNLHSIGDILGFTEKKPKVELLYNYIVLDGGAFHKGDLLIHIQVVKNGPGPVRNCKVEIQHHGRLMTIRNATYGTSFSMPDGRATRDVMLAVIPFGPNIASSIFTDYPRAVLFCDDIASRELEIPAANKDVFYDPKSDRP